MLVEVNTDLHGVTTLLAFVAWVNIHDCQRRPELLADLERRCKAPPGVGFQYVRDPAWIGLCPAPDRWSTFAVLAERTSSDKPIEDDCEGLAAAYAAAAWFWGRSHGRRPKIEVAIAQPRPGAMAHAFMRFDGQVVDPSVRNGMRAPSPDFYVTGDVVAVDLESLCGF